MTRARAHTVAEGQHGLYHCVRRAWLCGVDPLTRVDHEQRKPMVEARIRELATIFAVGIYVYAVMSICTSWWQSNLPPPPTGKRTKLPSAADVSGSAPAG